MAESSVPTVHAFHLVMRDAEEGGIHYAYEIEPYFALPTDVVESLGATVSEFAQAVAKRAFKKSLESDSDDEGMDPWFQVDELPAGSTVPQLIQSRKALEAFLVKAYRHACCIGLE